MRILSNYITKVKLLILAVLLLALIISLSCASSQQGEHNQNGRYQLIQASYNPLYPNGNDPDDLERKTIFKIDTQTGQVWRYEERFSATTGDIPYRWVELK